MYISGFYDRDIYKYNPIKRGTYFKLNCGGACDWILTENKIEEENRENKPIFCEKYNGETKFYIFHFWEADMKRLCMTPMYFRMKAFAKANNANLVQDGETFFMLTNAQLPKYNDHTEEEEINSIDDEEEWNIMCGVISDGIDKDHNEF